MQPERTLAYSPLIQVLLALEEPPVQVTVDSVTFAPQIVENGTSKFDLALGVTDRGTHLDCRLTYDTDLFEAPTAEMITASLVSVARSVAADPDVRLADIDMLAAPTRTMVLGTWGTGADLPERGDLVDLLAGALGSPSVAVGGPDGTLTGSQVLQWSGQIATVLRGAGIGPESMVGLCLPRGAGLIPAMLGVWMAGAAYVPIDPGYPAERLRHMVADAGVRVVLAPSALAGLVRGLVGTGVTVVRVDAPDVRAANAIDAGTEVPPERAGVHHLHVGVHRPAQGRLGAPWRGRGAAAGVPRGPGLRCR